MADPTLQVYGDGTVLVGRDPWRLLRLTPAGAARARRLLVGEPTRDDADIALARRLMAAGLAHPRPGSATYEIDVVVPAHGRAAELAQCLEALGEELAVTVVDDGSTDAAAIARVAATQNADVVRRGTTGGPAAARNAGLRATAAELVAFVDSDCRISTSSLATLAGHFADPSVAAVAPRVRPSERPQRSWLIRYATARSPLDLGPVPAAVRPQGRVGHVPTTALLVRRAAVESVGGFDERLRYGEDVDLVWRLVAAGWSVRYDPDVVARHDEPVTWGRWLGRRFRYGTSAGPLARRHPDAMRGPALVGLFASRVVARRAADLPPEVTRRLAVTAPLATGRALLRWGVPLWWPLLLVVARRHAAVRTAAVAAVVVPLLLERPERRPRLDPARWSVAAFADDAAYGAGVWWGCLLARTVRPLLPRWRVDRTSASDRGPGADDETRLLRRPQPAQHLDDM